VTDHVERPDSNRSASGAKATRSGAEDLDARGNEPRHETPARSTGPSDAELVSQHLAGDTAAFAQIVERYQRLVFKIAYSKANDRDDADDIAQEIFLHAHRSLPKLRDPHSFLAWLMAIAQNRANRYCRSRQSRRRRLEEIQRRALEASEQERRRELRGDESTGVHEIVGSLAAEYRSALTWKYLEGLSYEEIGKRLSMSFHQVDYLLRRAKRALRVGIERQRLDDSDAENHDGVVELRGDQDGELDL